MALADPKKAKAVHILADGTVVDSIEGYIVPIEGAEAMYRMFYEISTTGTSSVARAAQRRREEKEGNDEYNN